MRAFELPSPVEEAADILAVYLRHPPAQAYGIADVVQLWDASRWWREGNAVVGLIALPGSPVPVLYAVSPEAPGPTLDLLGALAPGLPAQLVAHGPRGLSARLARWYEARFSRPYLKLHLADPGRLPEPSGDVVGLTRADARDLARLYASDPTAGELFHPGLLDSGLYVGLRRGEDLVAAGGIHVLEESHGVAALANVVTHPDHRRLGMGRAVVAGLCHRVLERVPVVTLNVQERNTPARGLYRELGFVAVHAYEEAALLRRFPHGRPSHGPAST